VRAVAAREGTIPFLGLETWYRVVGEDTPGKLPLLCLHGGPGSGHDYLEPMEDLATGRRAIFYDQLGSGRSPAPSDPSRWTVELYLDELSAVREALGLERIHLLGQSWGGMLSAEIAVRRPAGLKSVAICNSPASMELWMAGAAELRAQLPPDTQAALTRHEEAGTVTDPEYLEATDEFYRRHLCRVVPMPQDLVDTIAQTEAEPTVYHTMNGPNEFHVLGTLRGWSIIDRLPEITAPTLVIAGEFDEATPATWQPYVDHISGAESQVFPDTSHCSHLEKPEEFRAVVAAFLASHDAVARI
jgi:L-proline amide hydrolase